MKKIFSISEEEILNDIVDYTVSEVKKNYTAAFFSISLLFIAFVITAALIIESQFHAMLALCMLTFLYLFSIFALKSYSMIQIGMINKFTKLKNTEEEKNGATKNG